LLIDGMIFFERRATPVSQKKKKKHPWIKQRLTCFYTGTFANQMLLKSKALQFSPIVKDNSFHQGKGIIKITNILVP
jgi:hypothetical protein